MLSQINIVPLNEFVHGLQRLKIYINVHPSHVKQNENTEKVCPLNVSAETIVRFKEGWVE